MDKKRRIAIIVNSIVPGFGVNNAAITQARALSSFFSVTLICAHGDCTDTDLILHKVRAPSLLWMRRFGHAITEYLLCRRFSVKLNTLDNIDPFDFILFHSHSSAVVVRSKLSRPIACGMVVHGDIFTRPKGSYDPLLTKLYQYYSKRAYCELDLILALSPAMKSKAIQYGAEAHRVEVLPNGINTQSIVARSFGQSKDGGLTLLFVGRLSPEKAPMILLESLRFVSSRIELCIAGTGVLDVKMRKYVQAYGLEASVHFLGQIDKTELKRHYRRSDVLCVPSISDTLPTVVLEAMYEGLPVIASDVDGIPFMIEDSVNGLLVPHSDPLALGKAIDLLAKSEGIRQKMSVATQHKLITQFGLQSVTEQLANHIGRVIIPQ